MLKASIEETKLEIHIKGNESELVNDLLNIIGHVIVSMSEGNATQQQGMSMAICKNIKNACEAAERGQYIKVVRSTQAPQ